ncbi:MAG: hypothetical protein RL338_594 [Chloroflexota bacterium]
MSHASVRVGRLGFGRPSLPGRTQPEPSLADAAPRRRLLAVAGIVAALILVALPLPAGAWEPLAYAPAAEDELLVLTNATRADAGLSRLAIDPVLVSVARERSRDMAERGYFAHEIPPSGEMVFSILDERGYCYALAGENIGWSTHPDETATATIHGMFMGSSTHRDNILGSAWSRIGIGAFEGADGKKLFTVLFSEPCATAAADPARTAASRPTKRAATPAASPSTGTRSTASTASTPAAETPAPPAVPAEPGTPGAARIPARPPAVPALPAWLPRSAALELADAGRAPGRKAAPIPTGRRDSRDTLPWPGTAPTNDAADGANAAAATDRRLAAAPTSLLGLRLVEQVTVPSLLDGLLGRALLGLVAP